MNILIHLIIYSYFCCYYIEKNVGLFLQSAYYVLQKHPFVRFTIVGDGILRQSLENLAIRLDIYWAIDFLGWVSTEKLPAVLAGVDIVVNPSLRAWSETFCISNIEVLSMSVPLVTFAVGGIGEYVDDVPMVLAGKEEEGYLEQRQQEWEQQQQREQKQSQQQHYTTNYTISTNAVILHYASPEVISSAVNYLLLNPAVRAELGRAGRETVLKSFTTARQMEQYSQLYEFLHTYK